MKTTKQLYDISIIICTCNRAQSLQETLTAIKHVEVPEQLKVELLVVDNASTDNTPAVVSSTCIDNIDVRYIQEGQPGLSRARNTGIRKALGNIILFLDDDVRPPRNWISGMSQPIRMGIAEVVIGGVEIAPHLDRPWLCGHLRSWFGCTDHMRNVRPTTLVGANMAFAHEVFDKIPCFDTELGAGALGSGEDVLFSLQIQEAGFRTVGSLDIAVEHHFDETRLSRSAILNIATKYGHSGGYLLYHWFQSNVFLPHVRLVKHQLELQFLRMIRHSEMKSAEGCPEWEALLVHDVNKYKRYLIEQRRPRKYTFRSH